MPASGPQVAGTRRAGSAVSPRQRGSGTQSETPATPMRGTLRWPRRAERGRRPWPVSSSRPRRGEVWLVSFGAARAGELGKNRPAVIISGDQLSGAADELVVVVPLSSSRRPSSVGPEVAAVNGIHRPSGAMCRGIRAVARVRLLRRLGALSPTTLAEVERALALVLGLNDHAQGQGSAETGRSR
jgi:mRNA interferase MazF